MDKIIFIENILQNIILFFKDYPIFIIIVAILLGKLFFPTKFLLSGKNKEKK
tara:strand:+ start:207 stop:362 length:156 start_codon:yes stop_codon:yes gene_type:complete